MKAFLVLARRGHGKFRKRVEFFEGSCRVTGVTSSKNSTRFPILNATLPVGSKWGYCEIVAMLRHVQQLNFLRFSSEILDDCHQLSVCDTYYDLGESDSLSTWRNNGKRYTSSKCRP
jgi:hypothetical protein